MKYKYFFVVITFIKKLNLKNPATIKITVATGVVMSSAH
jgi:hypothetical protein